MTGFDEVRLPTCIEKGAQGGPQFNTTIITLSSGFEKRNINWSKSRAAYDISYGMKEKTDLDAVISFFYARQGKARGFRFKDWADFQLTRQGIGIGDGSNADYQIYKRYTSGGVDYDRILTKIVTGTLSVWVNNSLSSPSNYTLDENTGIITFGGGHIPLAAQVVEAACEFDVPVRFDIDHLGVTMSMIDLGAVPQISLVELKQ